MNSESAKKRTVQALAIMVLFLLTSWISLPVGAAWAFRPKGDTIPLYPPIGMDIQGPLKGLRPVHIGTLTYFFLEGIFYRPTAHGYVVVAPPMGPVQPDENVAWEGDQIQVTVSILNVRSGPGMEHSIIKNVQKGDLLVVQSSSSGWYYVKLPDNSFGWVMERFTSLAKPRALGLNAIGNNGVIAFR